jgi:hypothetical protein
MEATTTDRDRKVLGTVQRVAMSRYIDTTNNNHRLSWSAIEQVCSVSTTVTEARTDLAALGNHYEGIGNTERADCYREAVTILDTVYAR